jgi:hypothetical protein
MIIQALRSKNIVRQIGLYLPVIAAIAVPAALRPLTVHIPEDSSAYYAWFAGWLVNTPHFVQFVIVWSLMIVVWISLGRLVFADITRHNRLALALFLSLISLVAFPENIGIHPPLVAMTLFIPAIKSMLKAADTKSSGVQIFNAGFLLSLASLIAFPLILFFPSFFIALLVFRLYKWNYWGMLAAGLILPWLYAFSLGWVFDFWPGPDLYSVAGIWLSGILYFFTFIHASFSPFHYISILLISGLSIASFVSIYPRLDQQLLIVRYLYRSLLWILLPGFLVLLISGGMVLQYMIFLGFFFTMVGSVYLESTRKTRVLNILLFLLIANIMVSHLSQLI